MDLNEAKELLEENGYILDEGKILNEGIFDSIKNKFFKKKEAEVPEVQPMKKKLYDDQITKTSQQAYNHTTESMSVLKQVANNFNGKKAGEFKQLWSGLSKLLNKHGMSVKNHNYLGITNNNAEFSVWAYIANPETDWTDIKIIGRVKANVSEYKYTTNYNLDDSSLKGQAEDLNEWLVELDSIALKLFKGASREEWEEGAHQNESKVNKAIKLLESAGYIVEDTDDWDEADMPIGTPKQRADRVKKHEYFRDLDHKTTDTIENGELTKKLVKNSIEREFRGLIAKQYNSKGLQNAYNQWRERDFKSRGWHGGTNGLEGALDNSSKMSEITEALADVVYDAIKDIQIEQA